MNIPTPYDTYEPEEARYYKCPICGLEIHEGDEVYLYKGAVVGCQNCVKAKQAYEVFEEDE